MTVKKRLRMRVGKVRGRKQLREDTPELFVKKGWWRELLSAQERSK